MKKTPTNRKIAIVISAYNEENNIEECIKSALLLTDNIVFIDTESTDGTKEKAHQLGACVYSFPFLHYVEPSRNFALEKADAEWVFILDADERITIELAAEITKNINNKERNEYTHLMVPRKNIMLRKKWLKYGGWYPDYIIRLIQKEHFVSWPQEIHSTPQINGKMGFLKEPLEHYFQPSLEYVVSKTSIYEALESQLLYKAHRPVSTRILFRKFFGELIRRLIIHRGFMDGTYGIIESFYQAFSKTITYIFLYEDYEKSPTV